MSQYTIIYKYGERMRQLKTKRELKNFPQETMTTSKNRFAPKLNEKEVIIELLEDLPNILGAFLIIPLALVGYDMIIANSAPYASLTIYHLLIPKWPPINYSFVCMLISPLCLVNRYKKQKNFEVKMRPRGLIQIQTKE